MKPPTGYYRQLLPAQYNHVRIAFTHTPVVGMVVMGDLVEPLAKHFDTLTNDPHAAYYADALRSGKTVPVVEPSRASDSYVWKPGELFMRS